MPLGSSPGNPYIGKNYIKWTKKMESRYCLVWDQIKQIIKKNTNDSNNVTQNIGCCK